MITDSTGNYVLSNLGWVDDGRVWRFDVSTGEHESIRLSDADYLYLSGNHQSVFSAVHRFEGALPIITAQTFEDPKTPIASITFDGAQGRMTGDDSVWASLKKNYFVRLGDTPHAHFVAQISGNEVKLIQLDWFNAKNYDFMYQGIEDVVEVPDSATALVSVQRSERLLLCDLASFKILREIHLPDQPGDPQVLNGRQQAWLVNYDIVQSINLVSMSLDRNAIDEESRAAGMFLGSVWISDDEQTAVVARPACGDVKVFNTGDMSLRSIIRTGGQPIESVVLRDGRVVGRDWETGKLLTGK